MKNKFFSISIVSFLAGLVLWSCYPKSDVPAASANGVDFSKYVAVGNSITSGYADAALYYEGQLVSYPNLIAQQLKLVGGGEFKQPLVPQNSVGIGSSGNARKILGMATDCKNVTSLSPVDAASTGDLSIFATSIATQGPFNNMGVPGAKAITTVYPGYGNPINGAGAFNPFFTRMASNPEKASMLSDAVAQNPTFFSLFIGANDVLGYATSGGTQDFITPSAGNVGYGFDASIDAIVAGLTSNNAKGVIANVPDVTSLPYFTTIPYDGLVLDTATAAYLNTVYSNVGLGFIKFVTGKNPFIVVDANATGGLRKMTSEELVLLTTPQDSLKCANWGSAPNKPLASQFVLTKTEVDAIKAATDAYNAKLKAVAEAKGLAFVDANAFMKNCKSGVVYNGVTISATFVTGGAFSLDGVHLTPIGNAMLANEFIKAINAKYGSSIPQVIVTNYGGVKFPVAP